MKREIKFRGKRIDNEEWIYGYLIGGRFNDDERKDFYICQGVGGDCIEVDPETVGQLLGYTIDGKEVYEADVAQWYYGDYEEPCTSVVGLSDSVKEYTIIGNIYDNPELLK